ncbi:MAG TPA: M48 family metallopeptidase [Candidatus Sulfotelmatobacter sp.]|nr:M48 family metallopeptidase [Candidatus Sulfotelmatobacter sp.]
MLKSYWQPSISASRRFTAPACARKVMSLFLAFVLTVPSAFANVDPKLGRVTTNPTAGDNYTIEQEVEFGQKAVPQIERELPLLPVNHPVSKYINALGQRLAAKAPGYRFPYTFRVVRQKEINAFAVPGGPVYVNTGTIAAANEAELAGVMGHEIAHIVMRHSTRQASRQTKAAIPLAILSGVLGASVGGWAGQLAQMGISIGAGSVFTKYSRDSETEADMVGAQIMYDAGYDPRAMVSFFETLKSQQGQSSGPSFLASHPDPGDRARNVGSILARFPAKQYQTADSPEFLAAKQSLAGLGANEVQSRQELGFDFGLRRLSSEQFEPGAFTTYERGGFRVSIPGKWKISGNLSSSVTVYPEGGADFQTVSYGAIISAFTPSRAGRDLEEGLRELIRFIRDTNAKLRATTNLMNLTVGGRAAKAIEMLGESAIREDGQPLAERIRLVALQSKSSAVLYLVFVAPDADFDSLRPTFDRILRSFTLN